jgi:integrase
MATPRPRWDEGRGCWIVDLRARALGALATSVIELRGVAREDRDGAWEKAVAVFLCRRAEAEAAAAHGQQQRLPLGAGPSWKAATLALLDERLRLERPSAANADYFRTHYTAVARDLGRLFVAAFESPLGDEILIGFRNDMAARGLRPKTRHKRLSVAGQVLAYCRRKGWLRALPEIPKATVGDEVLGEAEVRWLTEEDFRTLRDRLWEDHDVRGHGLRSLKVNGVHLGHDREARLAYIARRKLYISAGFYTGMHTSDLDRLDDRSLVATTGNFLRRNTKSARCVREVQLSMPEALWADVREEVERLGRFWRPHEAVAGGRWTTVCRVLGHEADRLNLPGPIGPTIFRHSVAYHLCLLGWAVADVADYLGHVDTSMVQQVYNQVPARDRLRERHDWTNANMAKVRGGLTRRAHVFSFEAGKKGRALAAQRESGTGPRLHTVAGAGDDDRGRAG